LAEYLRINRPQVLLSAMGHANLAAIVAKLLAHHKLRLAISLHSTMGKVEGKKGAERTVLKYLLKVLNRYADEIIAVSQGVADDYASCMSLEKDRIKVIFNPAVSPEIFRKAETLPCHKWFTPKDGPVVLAVGRLTREKDYPTLVKAFRIVRRKINARLIILGEGEERTAIERLIQTEGLANSVSMPGYMENPFSFMRHADVFVLSSKWEGFGMVLAEAMALGTPVVSTDCPGGPAEILAGGRWGKLVPVGDTQSLAHAIIETVRNPVRDAAIERACAFSTEAILHEYAHALHIEI
jgi:glycosyltransferase involved in cell wall biosynthesis